MSPTRVGYFRGPWGTGTIARDGGVHGFRNVELTIRKMTRSGALESAVPLENLLFAQPAKRRVLADLDVVYANAGPATTLLMLYRETMNLDFRIVREIRTLGWIGYAFQEFIAAQLARPSDTVMHTSSYSAAVWNRFRKDRDFLHYPMFRPRFNPASNGRPPGERHVAYYGSRVARDKGFAYLPSIIERLNDRNWRIHRLIVCGEMEDASIEERETLRSIEGLGVAVDLRGPQVRGRALSLMNDSDVVLYPSVSSFEASGRIVAEAWALGKAVIASQFCSGFDLLRPTHQIPLITGSARSGPARVPFEVSQLAIDGWTAPSPDAKCFREDSCRNYETSHDRMKKVLTSGLSELRLPEVNLRMKFDWPSLDKKGAVDLCGRIGELVERGFRDREDLTNPGGLFKRAVIESGFDPTAHFATE